jgi:hypothetical protein
MSVTLRKSLELRDYSEAAWLEAYNDFITYMRLTWTHARYDDSCLITWRGMNDAIRTMERWAVLDELKRATREWLIKNTSSISTVPGATP